MDDPVADRVIFYDNLKKLTKETQLVTDQDSRSFLYESSRKSTYSFMEKTFRDDCLHAVYGKPFFCRTTAICFKVWAKLTENSSLFIIGVAPTYASVFCEEFIPRVDPNCPTVSIVAYSQLRNELVELYCNF
jgi:hypothetical protein